MITPLAVRPSAIPAATVERQLDRMISSRLFMRSPRLSRFMEYVVGAHLEGRDSEIKEYSVGLEVFDRSEDFDPRVDPIVRVEAGRLRNKIREYYLNDGVADIVLLTLSRRGYRPIVSTRSQHQPPLARIRETPAPIVKTNGGAQSVFAPAHSLTVAILTFKNLNAVEDRSSFGQALSDELANSLTRNQLLGVISRHGTARLGEEIEAIRDSLHAETVLAGSVHWVDDRLRVRVQLIDTATGLSLWADVFESHDDGVFRTLDQLTSRIAGGLQAFLSGNAVADRRWALTA